MKIRLVLLGKTRRAECRAMLDDYVARIKRYAEVELAEVREDSAALKRLKFPPGASVVLLDAAGKQHTSAEFARWLGRERDRGVREIVFLCGGAEGFPEALRKQAHGENFPLLAHHAARTRARCPGRTNLSWLRHPGGPPVSEIASIEYSLLV